MSQVKGGSGPGGRAQAAELSRETIATAARRLFRERGYAEATMEAIAAEAGFAVQTVYFHFKSKAAILTRLVDELVAQQVVPRHERAMSSTRPTEQLRVHAAIACAAFDNGWDLLRALSTAGRSDPGLASLLSEWERGHLSGLTHSIRRLFELGALRPGLEETTAVDIAWALTSPELYRLLRVERGWDGEDYEQWLARALSRELLGTNRRTKPARKGSNRQEP